MQHLQIPDELMEIAMKELGETPERRVSTMAELRRKLSDSKTDKKHLPLHRDDDGYLLMFLRHAKFDTKKAYARLQAMERWMQANAEALGDLRQYCAEDFRALYGVGFMKAVEGHSKDGAQVMMLLPLRLRPGDIPDPTLLLKWNVWTLHRSVHDPYIQISGQLIIETFQGMSFLQALQFGKGCIPPNIMKQNMNFMSQCAPYRLNGIWLFHQGTVVSILMAMVRPFMSQKMKQRIRAFGADMSLLHETVDASKLPPEFGGSSTDDGWVWFEAMKQKELQERQQQQQQQQ